MNKLVRESIDMNFERGQDPKYAMGLGRKFAIVNWLKDMGINKYILNDDLSIDVITDVNLVDHHLSEFPEFIQFNKIWGGFYVGANAWQSLNGFPREITGDLQINSPSAFSLGIKKFNETEIKKIINVYGEIYV